MLRMGSLLPLLMIAFSGSGAVARAAELELVGVFGSKAVLVIDGGVPKTLAVGEQTRDGIRLLEVSSGAAVVEADGRRQRLMLGAAPLRTDRAPSGASGVSLFADSRGHHFSSGSINGASVRFLVDTGASMISIGVGDARRAGIDFRRGIPAITETASGRARVWHVRLDTVRLGDITLHGVDGLVHENDLPFVLLGMSFLSRMDMQREGDRLVLRKRF